VTDMALAYRILGKFLGVVCHCFPPANIIIIIIIIILFKWFCWMVTFIYAVDWERITAKYIYFNVC